MAEGFSQWDEDVKSGNTAPATVPAIPEESSSVYDATDAAPDQPRVTVADLRSILTALSLAKLYSARETRGQAIEQLGALGLLDGHDPTVGTDAYGRPVKLSPRMYQPSEAEQLLADYHAGVLVS